MRAATRGGRSAEAIIEAVVPLVTAFTARTYVDKYGPDSRYDILDRASSLAAPLLITLGVLEIDGLAFRDLAEQGPALHTASPQVSYSLISGADHSYASSVPELVDAFRGWLTEAGVVRVQTGLGSHQPTLQATTRP